MDINFLLRIAEEPLPYRTVDPVERTHIERLIKDQLIMGYTARSESPLAPDLATVLSITPDGRALMAIRRAEQRRKVAAS